MDALTYKHQRFIYICNSSKSSPSSFQKVWSSGYRKEKKNVQLNTYRRYHNIRQLTNGRQLVQSTKNPIGNKRIQEESVGKKKVEELKALAVYISQLGKNRAAVGIGALVIFEYLAQGFKSLFKVVPPPKFLKLREPDECFRAEGLRSSILRYLDEQDIKASDREFVLGVLMDEKKSDEEIKRETEPVLHKTGQQQMQYRPSGRGRNWGETAFQNIFEDGQAKLQDIYTIIDNNSKILEEQFNLHFERASQGGLGSMNMYMHSSGSSVKDIGTQAEKVQSTISKDKTEKEIDQAQMESIKEMDKESDINLGKKKLESALKQDLKEGLSSFGKTAMSEEEQKEFEGRVIEEREENDLPNKLIEQGKLQLQNALQQESREGISSFNKIALSREEQLDFERRIIEEREENDLPNELMEQGKRQLENSMQSFSTEGINKISLSKEEQMDFERRMIEEREESDLPNELLEQGKKQLNSVLQKEFELEQEKDQVRIQADNLEENDIPNMLMEQGKIELEKVREQKLSKEQQIQQLQVQVEKSDESVIPRQLMQQGNVQLDQLREVEVKKEEQLHELGQQQGITLKEEISEGPMGQARSDVEAKQGLTEEQEKEWQRLQIENFEESDLPNLIMEAGKSQLEQTQMEHFRQVQEQEFERVQIENREENDIPNELMEEGKRQLKALHDQEIYIKREIKDKEEQKEPQDVNRQSVDESKSQLKQVQQEESKKEEEINLLNKSTSENNDGYKVPNGQASLEQAQQQEQQQIQKQQSNGAQQQISQGEQGPPKERSGHAWFDLLYNRTMTTLKDAQKKEKVSFKDFYDIVGYQISGDNSHQNKVQSQKKKMVNQKEQQQQQALKQKEQEQLQTEKEQVQKIGLNKEPQGDSAKDNEPQIRDLQESYQIKDQQRDMQQKSNFSPSRDLEQFGEDESPQQSSTSPQTNQKSQFTVAASLPAVDVPNPWIQKELLLQGDQVKNKLQDLNKEGALGRKQDTGKGSLLEQMMKIIEKNIQVKYKESKNGNDKSISPQQLKVDAEGMGIKDLQTKQQLESIMKASIGAIHSNLQQTYQLPNINDLQGVKFDPNQSQNKSKFMTRPGGGSGIPSGGRSLKSGASSGGSTSKASGGSGKGNDDNGRGSGSGGSGGGRGGDGKFSGGSGDGDSSFSRFAIVYLILGLVCAGGIFFLGKRNMDEDAHQKKMAEYDIKKDKKEDEGEQEEKEQEEKEQEQGFILPQISESKSIQQFEEKTQKLINNKDFQGAMKVAAQLLALGIVLWTHKKQRPFDYSDDDQKTYRDTLRDIWRSITGFKKDDDQGDEDDANQPKNQQLTTQQGSDNQETFQYDTQSTQDDSSKHKQSSLYSSQSKEKSQLAQPDMDFKEYLKEQQTLFKRLDKNFGRFESFKKFQGWLSSIKSRNQGALNHKDLNKGLEILGQEIKQLNQSRKQIDRDYALIKNQKEVASSKIGQLVDNLIDSDNQKKQFQSNAQAHEKQYKELQKQIVNAEKTCMALNQLKYALEMKISEQNIAIQELNDQVKDQQQQLELLQESLEQQSQANQQDSNQNNFEQREREYEQQIEQNNKECESLRQQNEQDKQKIQRLENELQEAKELPKLIRMNQYTLQEQLTEKVQQLNESKDNAQLLEQNKQHLQRQIKEKEALLQEALQAIISFQDFPVNEQSDDLKNATESFQNSKQLDSDRQESVGETPDDVANMQKLLERLNHDYQLQNTEVAAQKEKNDHSNQVIKVLGRQLESLQTDQKTNFNEWESQLRRSQTGAFQV